MSNRRRTYLNYLFENMTYLDNITGNVYLESIDKSKRTFESNNILNGHNLGSYNKLMIIFQSSKKLEDNPSSIGIITINNNQELDITNNQTYILFNGITARGEVLRFSDNKLYVYGEYDWIKESEANIGITNMIIIEINE